jgi:hypothetical protein
MADLISQLLEALREQIGEELDPAIPALMEDLRSLVPKERLQPLHMWQVFSDTGDGSHMDLLVLACTEEAARQYGWIEFTERIFGGECDCGDERYHDPDGEHMEWQHYHRTSDGLRVIDQGVHVESEDERGLNLGGRYLGNG